MVLKIYSISSLSQILMELSLSCSSPAWWMLIHLLWEKHIFFMLHITAQICIFIFPLHLENLAHLHTFNHNYYKCWCARAAKPHPDTWSIFLHPALHSSLLWNCCCFLFSVTLIFASQNSSLFCSGTSNPINSRTTSESQI